ncbi:MAG TPA: glycosyltransferase family 2 protein [Gemmatimonadota bacterium]|nr:glycosyltransferase family 2 protein [Gemmatimonadota bacterium]
MSRGARIAVVIPMRDEREAVGPLFVKLAAVFAELPGMRAIVVDGGSTDGTRDEVRRHGAGLPVGILELDRGLGLGDALEAGLRHVLATSDVVVTLDGDDSHDPRTIPALVARLEEGYDVVVASRFASGGAEIGVAPHRRALSHVASAVLRSLFPMGEVRDYSSGFRAYRTRALEALAAGGRLVGETGFSCMLDLLLRLRARGFRAAEVPLVLRYDLKASASKMDVPGTVLRYLVLIGRNWRPRRSIEIRGVR